MIHGIGTDIVVVSRMAELWQRHGERAMQRFLAPDEYAECLASTDRARFMAKRFAAKEALGKALGTGVRTPVLLPAIAVVHDELGKPAFRFGAELAHYLNQRGLITHLSISDEQEHAVAFVVVEKP